MWEKNETSCYQLLKKDPAHYHGHSHRRRRHCHHQYHLKYHFHRVDLVLHPI